jgi:hypothetical protein
MKTGRVRSTALPTLRCQRDIVQAVDDLIPISDKLPISHARLLQTYRAVMVEGIDILRTVLGWDDIELGRSTSAPVRQVSRVVGRSIGSWTPNGISVAKPGEDVCYDVIQGSMTPAYPLASEFAGRVMEATYAALEAAFSLDRARSAVGPHP